MTELRIQMAERIGWLGLIFGAVYTGLYARFSSQWTYLANLYNQIKQVEASTTQRNGMNKQAMAEWKAGFIEDAENLHLACKSSFVPIIRAWATDELVQEKYIEHTPGGKERLMRLMNEVADIFDDLREKQYRENQLRLPPFNPGKARGSTGRHL